MTTGTPSQKVLAAKAKNHGARNYSLRLFIEADRTEHVSKSLALALCEQESGFRNVYGHDGVRNPVKSPPGGFLLVTLLNYRRYKRHRDAGEGQQGVGPMQLTSKGYQDQADALGGCHIAQHNIRVAIKTLDGLIDRYGERSGLAAYNAGEGGMRAGNGFGYADSVIAKKKRWHKVLT